LSPKAKPRRKPARNKRESPDTRYIKAVAHPLRQEILSVLNEREASPKELSDQLGENLSHVSYHFRVLRDYECIELVRTEPRRGATEHYYKATSSIHLEAEELAKLPASVRNGISGAFLRISFADAAEALAAGALEAREDRNLTHMPMDVDEEGWRELGELGAEVLERAMAIKAASIDRLLESGEEKIPVTLNVMAYEAKPGRGKVRSQ
jgi:DNA-binding transcriptional ArsR family regulator